MNKNLGLFIGLVIILILTSIIVNNAKCQVNYIMETVSDSTMISHYHTDSLRTTNVECRRVTLTLFPGSGDTIFVAVGKRDSIWIHKHGQPFWTKGDVWSIITRNTKNIYFRSNFDSTKLSKIYWYYER